MPTRRQPGPKKIEVEEVGAITAVASVRMWKRLDQSELIAAGVLIALGVSIVMQARRWVYLTPDGPGPGYFPLWIGGVMIVLAAIVALRHVITALRKRPNKKPHWKGSAQALFGWAGIAVSIALLKPLGFVASFLLLVGFLVMVIFQRSFFAALSVGVGATLGFWLLFAKLLDVQLPQGPWGF